MISGIRIKNFKAIADSGWIDLKSINLIMGTNSSGKSSIGKALLFIKNVFSSSSGIDEFPYYIPLDVDGKSIGNFGSTVYDGEKSFEIGFNLDFSLRALKEFKERQPWLFNRAYSIIFTFTGNKKDYECILDTIEYKDFRNDETLVRIKNRPETFNVSIKQSALFKSGLNKNSITDYLIQTKRILNTQKSIFKLVMEPYDSLFDTSKLKTEKFEISKDDDVNNAIGFMAFPALTENIVSELKKKNFTKIEKQISPTFAELPDSPYQIESVDYIKLRNQIERKEVSLHPYIRMQLRRGTPHITPSDNDGVAFIKSYFYKYDSSNFLGDIMQHLNMEMKIFVSGLMHIGPQRNSDIREIEISRKSTNIWGKLYQDKNRSKKLSYVISTLNDEKIRDIRFKDKWDKFFSVEVKGKSGKWRNIMDIGFGFGQMLPALLGSLEDAFDKKRGPLKNHRTMFNNLLIIEEPEVHLHPKLAASLSRFFNKIHIDFGVRVILETHSEHFILKNQSEIKKQPVLSKMSQILFIERIYSNGKSFSQITPVTFKEDGQLNKKFPDDFFDISHNLYMELLK